MKATTDTSSEPAKSQDSSRLPCRGCLPDCRWRTVCDGRPWRTLETASGGKSV